MGKGGGKVGSNAYLGQAQHWLNRAGTLAELDWSTGQNIWNKYGQGVADPLLQMIQGVTGAGGQYVNPLLNQLMQNQLAVGGQAATGARRQAENMGYGPGVLPTVLSQINLGQTAAAQTGANNMIMQGLQQMLGLGQTGLGMMTQAPGVMAGIGGQFANMGEWYASMQAQAQQSGNMGMMQGLSGLGTLFGLIGSAAMPGGGSLFGAGLGSLFGGGAGAGAAGAGAGMVNYSLPSSFGNASLGYTPFNQWGG